MRFENFISGTYQSWSANVDAERAINLYPEVVESAGGKSRVVLYGTPGLATFCTLPTSPVRALWAGEQRLFAVGGSKLYEISSGGTATSLGDVGDDADHTPATIWSNSGQLFIVSAGYGWVATGTAVVPAPVPPADDIAPGTPAGTEQTASTGCFLDGYFIAAKPDTKRFYFSDALDGTTWDPLEFSTKESYPDNIAALFPDHEELWIFGTHDTTEVWRNEGDADAAGGFRRDPGAMMHVGLAAPWSVVSLAQGLHFLGGDNKGTIIAYRAQGFQPVRVSNHAVEQIWSRYETVEDAYGYAYIHEGHSFWVLNFQTANATWVYDQTTQMWHERAYWNGSGFDRHRGRCHAYVFGKHFVGDHANGKVYEMSHGFYDDAGTPLRRVRQAPAIANEQQRVFHHSLQVDLEITGSDPDVSLDWSDDDTDTWSAVRTRAPSKANKTGRVIFNRLGSSRDRIYRVTISDPVKVAILDAYLNPQLTPGTS